MKELDPITAADAPWWDEAYKTNYRAKDWTVWHDRRAVEHAAKAIMRLKQPKISIVLLACGRGHAAINIQRYAQKYAAAPELTWHYCDFSDQALALVEDGAPFGSSMKLDLAQIPWPYLDRQFDVVIMSEFLELLGDPKAAIAEAQRICRRLLIATFPLHPDLESDTVTRWRFEPLDPHKLLRNMKAAHQLREKKLLLTFSQP